MGKMVRKKALKLTRPCSQMLQLKVKYWKSKCPPVKAWDSVRGKEVFWNIKQPLESAQRSFGQEDCCVYGSTCGFSVLSHFFKSQDLCDRECVGFRLDMR
jgi:hypothetical protein